MMDFYKCSNCSAEFVSRRAICPNCSSTDWLTIEERVAVALDSVKLIATPSPFPDEYAVVLFKTENGGKGFCRTRDAVMAGDRVLLDSDEYGTICRLE